MPIYPSGISKEMDRLFHPEGLRLLFGVRLPYAGARMSHVHRLVRLSALGVVVAVAPSLAAPASLASVRGQTTGASPEGLVALDAQLKALTRRVAPAVVQVVASGYAAGGEALLTRARSYGSGAVVDSDGWIVTNAHVVDGASAVHVELLRLREPGEKGSILRPRSRRLPARVVGSDRETDVAVLKVEATDLASLPLGDSDDLRQGQLVLAFGSPLGLENSASLGVVSAVARQLAPDSPMIYVQTDASINPGNSGGPLVDVEGRMVGLNTLIASHSGGDEGIGFAAPSNIVRSVFEQIREQGRVRRGVIGVSAQTITPELGDGLGLGVHSGVVLSDVRPGGPAAAAGLRIGDIIVALDGKPMENARQLDVNVYQRALGDAVALDVVRSGVRLSFEVTVLERPQDPDRFMSLVTPESNLVSRLGVLALELDDDLLKVAGPLRGKEGVLVAARAGGDSGPDYDLRPGDVIYAVNGVSVRGLTELRQAVGRPRQGESLVLQVERGGELLFVVVELQ
jgi:serine protease Do